jgi:MerR family transcriptional regulator, light-induced transcriptional regulator
MNEHTYPIRAVSKLTGLSVDTLRAWERRYDAVKPARTGRGRTYSEADISRLNLLREAVEAGHAIGQVASLSDERLKELGSRVSELTARHASSMTTSTSASVSQTKLQTLLDGIEQFDSRVVDRELNRLATLASPRELVHNIVIPLMQKVGDQWYRGELSVSQEHMTSALLRNLLGGLVRLYARASPPATLLLATPSGERHEFGILCAAMLAAAGGLGIVYLGASLPASEIVDAAKRASVQVVVLAIKGATSSKEPLREIQRISQALPEGVELWTGGPTSHELGRQIRKTRALFLPDFNALEQHLTRCGARF